METISVPPNPLGNNSDYHWHNDNKSYVESFKQLADFEYFATSTSQVAYKNIHVRIILHPSIKSAYLCIINTQRPDETVNDETESV